MTETKTGCPGKGSVEPSGLRQIFFVKRDRVQMDERCVLGNMLSENGLAKTPRHRQMIGFYLRAGSLSNRSALPWVSFSLSS